MANPTIPFTSNMGGWLLLAQAGEQSAQPAGPQNFQDQMVDFVVKIFTSPINIGEGEISLLALLLILLLIIPAVFISRFIQKFIIARVIKKFGRLDRATEFLILKLTHYIIMVVAFFIILGTIGFDLSSLAVIFGLLSVGIGFGLQNLTANFISGLIILFERPIKVGDWVEVNEREGEVKEINLRATHIETNDAVYIIVPNREILSNNIINNTLGRPYLRVHTAMGVSYNSDMNKVREVLLNSAKKHPKVLESPEPEIWLVGFGDSSVDFEMLTWINSPKERIRTQAELYFSGWWALKEAGIEIPFPQRDLHLRSSDIKLPFRGEIVEAVGGKDEEEKSA